MARYEECQGRERFQRASAKLNSTSIQYATTLKQFCHCLLPISPHRSLDKMIQNEYPVLSRIVALGFHDEPVHSVESIWLRSKIRCLPRTPSWKSQTISKDQRNF